MNLAWYFMLFSMYSFLGWMCEVVYCSIPAKRFINRGFLHGPLCPVYGFGGLLIVFLLKPYAGTWFQLFFAAVFVTSVLEYITGWLLESLFHTKWWDYSHYRFNIHGRVCLINSVLFGLLGVIAVHFVHPFFLFVISLLDKTALWIVSGSLAVVIAADFFATVRAMAGFDARLAKLHAFTEDIKEQFAREDWFKGQNAASMLESVRQKALNDREKINRAILEKLEAFSKKDYGMTRLIKAFPYLASTEHGGQLDYVKEQIRQEFAKRRKHIFIANQEQNQKPPIQTQTPSFAAGICPYKLFWIFVIGCVLGTIIETLYCIFKTGEIQNRAGVIYGPFNPVYGFGAVLMTVLLYRMRNKRDLAIFAGSMVIGGAFEYCCSLFQELVFHTVSWEYSASPFNLHGRTNLLYAFFWGILGLLWVKELFPRLSVWIERIPNKAGLVLSWVVGIALVLDMGISAAAVKRLSERKRQIPATNEVHRFLDSQYSDDFLQEIYPNMIHVLPDE